MDQSTDKHSNNHPTTAIHTDYQPHRALLPGARGRVRAHSWTVAAGAAVTRGRRDGRNGRQTEHPTRVRF